MINKYYHVENQTYIDHFLWVHSLEVVYRVSETQLQVGENSQLLEGYVLVFYI